MSINLVQNFIVEVDSIKLLKQYLELALGTVLNSTEEIAVKVIDHADECKNLYYPSVIYGKKNILPVLMIEGWYGSEDNAGDSFFNGYKPWKLFNDENTINKSIEYAVSVLSENQSNLIERFSRDCGDGYNYGFNHFDGSVNVGYQLISNKRFPNSLTLSLVHIYYGK